MKKQKRKRRVWKVYYFYRSRWWADAPPFSSARAAADYAGRVFGSFSNPPLTPWKIKSYEAR